MDKHPLQIALEEIATETGKFFVHSYSGRGMYGKECLAISGRSLDILEVNLMAKVGKKLSDDRGLGVVYYWPNIPYAEEQTPAPKNVS